MSIPCGSGVKKLHANARDRGDMDSIPGLGRSPGEGNGNPLQNSCLENPMDRGAWWVRVLGVTQADTTEQAQAQVGINNNRRVAGGHILH